MQATTESLFPRGISYIKPALPFLKGGNLKGRNITLLKSSRVMSITGSVRNFHPHRISRDNFKGALPLFSFSFALSMGAISGICLLHGLISDADNSPKNPTEEGAKKKAIKM